jgi:hypothetical protein
MSRRRVAFHPRKEVSVSRSRNPTEPLPHSPCSHRPHHHQPPTTMPPARARNTDSDGSGAPAAKSDSKRRPAASHIPPPSLEKQGSTGSVNANGAHAHEGIEGVCPSPLPAPLSRDTKTASPSSRWAGTTFPSRFSTTTAMPTGSPFPVRRPATGA